MFRRLLQSALSLLLCLAALLGVSAFPAAADAGFENSEAFLRTSFNEENYLELSISGDMLTLSGRLQLENLSRLSVICGEASAWFDAADGEPFSVSLRLTHSGTETISVFTKATEEQYLGMVFGRICIKKDGDGCRILPSSVLESNLAFENAYADPERYRDDSGVPEEVRALSDEIAGDERDDYRKLWLLYQWVAENIYYDYDYYYKRSSEIAYDSGGVLANKRSVCAGYASLLKDLILAQGIPCMEVNTYALGVNTNGGSFATNTEWAAVMNSNHEHVAAWVNDRWVVMDVTWDSNNKYQDGEFHPKAPNGYYYFDITPEAFALDHKIIRRADGRMRMNADGVLTGADTPKLRVSVSGSPVVWTDAEPFIDENDRTMVPLRPVAAALGLTVDWDGAAREAVFSDGSRSLAFPIGSNLARTGDGTEIPMDTAAVIVHDRTYAPVRVLAEYFGFAVGWEPKTRTIAIEPAAP